MPAKIEISYKTIVFTVILLISLRLLLQILDIIFLVFISFIIMSAFKPWVEKLEKLHLPRVISIILVYLLIFSVIGYAGSTILPPLAVQSFHLGENLPSYIRIAAPFIQIEPQVLTQQIAPLGENLLKVTVGVFSNLIAVFSVIVISFYLLIERKQLDNILSSFIGHETAEKTVLIIKKVEERLGAWVRGQLTLMIFIGLAVYIGLTLLGIPFALSLSILSGIFEIIPVIGPIVSAIPAILIALTGTPFLALAVAALYFVIQQIEAHVVIPFVMKKAVGLPPLVTIIALMIGGRLNGIVGAILAVPIVVTLETVVSEYFKFSEARKKVYPD